MAEINDQLYYFRRQSSCNLNKNRENQQQILLMRYTETNNQLNKFSTIFLMAVLAWLTVCTPLVYSAMQKIDKQKAVERTASSQNSNDEDSSNPLTNSNEEKSSGTSTLTEEFLHDHHKTDCFLLAKERYGRTEDEKAYIAFHGELLVPPPNIA